MNDTRQLEDAVAELVPRAQRGDLVARDELLRKCHGTIYRWALIQTGDPADADDVAQEVLIRLHTSLHRYAGRSRFTTWLYRVTRNEALGLRRRVRSRLRMLSTMTFAAVLEPPETPAPQETGPGRLSRLAEKLLHDLPPRQREVFALADLELCPPAEIAERLGMKPVTVRAHLFRARRTMRKWMLERWPNLVEEMR